MRALWRVVRPLVATADLWLAGGDSGQSSLARSRWMLFGLVTLVALAGCTAPGAQNPATQNTETLDPGTPGIQFQNATNESGLNYSDEPDSGIGNGNAGVYALDYDGDGWTDLLTIGGTEPALFHNDGGTFERSGALPSLNRSFKSAAVVDVDDDGRSDLVLLPRYAEAVTLHNTGDSFDRIDAGLGNFSYPLGAAAADYDADGDADLFVYQTGNWQEGKPDGYNALNATLSSDNGYPNYLYENVGGEFQRVDDAGIEGDRWSLAASFTDLTGDGLADVHVANDYNTDVVYVNQGDGTFDQRLLRGATARNGMSSEVADLDGDGRPDVYTTNIELPLTRETLGVERYERYERMMHHVIHSGRTDGNTLMVNQGSGTFVDRANESGVKVGGWGWAATARDFDNDGRRDLMHTTQHVIRIDREDPHFTYPMVWWNEGDGFRNLDASEVGLPETDGRGLATLDYDRDGDVDVVTANYASQYTVLENTATGGNSLQFRVVDDGGATALGATVTVVDGDDEAVHHQQSRTDYLSKESAVTHVGLGETDSVDLVVEWLDGTEQTFEDVQSNQRVRITPDGLQTVTTFEDA